MQKMGIVGWPLIGISGLFLLMNSTAVAHEKVVVIPLNSSSAKIPNNTSNCDSSTAGVIRWTGSDFEGCNGTDWGRFGLKAYVPTVFSSGHEWMDRNLGASRVAKISNDVLAYGDLYQWGRYADGHEKRDSSETDLGDLSLTNTPGHGNFILTNTTPNDWRSTKNDDLWQGSGINNPCPAGFRIPTETEWEAERVSWGSNQNAEGAFSSPLKLVTAGLRNHVTGLNVDAGTFGDYWSITVDGNDAILLNFYSSGADTVSFRRASGHSVRCLKD